MRSTSTSSTTGQSTFRRPRCRACASAPSSCRVFPRRSRSPAGGWAMSQPTRSGWPAMAYFHDLTYVCAPSALQHGAAAGLEQIAAVVLHAGWRTITSHKRRADLARTADAGMRAHRSRRRVLRAGQTPTRLPGEDRRGKGPPSAGGDGRGLGCGICVLPPRARRESAALLLRQEGR